MWNHLPVDMFATNTPKAGDLYECAYCNEQMDGYTKNELRKEHGWIWQAYQVKGKNFALPLCRICAEHCAPIWEAQNKAKAA